MLERRMNNWLPALADLFLPDTCILCGMILEQPSPRLCCDFCWQAFPRIDQPCRHCAQPVSEGRLCGRCLVQPLTHGIAVVPLRYERYAQELIHQLKFKNSLRAARTLGQVLYESIVIMYAGQSLPEAIVPTPLSWRRHVLRGYNQCDRLSLELSAQLEVPIRHLLKRRHGPVQHGRSLAQRATQPRGSFELVRSNVPPHIALLDDVITTGTTMSNMARALNRGGARRIDLWAPCRAT